MSYFHVQQLAPVEEEFNAARAAIAYVERVWHRLSTEPEMDSLALPHVRRGAQGLEMTFIVRIFSEFEALLHDHLAARHPGVRIPRTAEALINRVASRERIPDPIREAAQAVREYRNVIVHRRAAAGTAMSFREVLSALNRFLARLPDPP